MIGSLIWNWFWSWLIGWGGLSLIVAAAAGAAWWFLPPIALKLRALAFNIALGALAFNFVYSMGYQDGASVTKREWLAAEARAVERGSDARENAEREVEPVEQEQPAVCDAPGSGAVDALPAAPAKPGVAPRATRRPVPRWMSNDRYNRDNH